jgi:hypothetical protein
MTLQQKPKKSLEMQNADETVDQPSQAAILHRGSSKLNPQLASKLEFV